MCMKRIPFIIFLLVVVSVTFANAQTADDHDNQSWNDVTLTFPVNEKFDVFVQGTLRFGGFLSRAQDTRVASGVVWKPRKDLSISPFYWYIQARNSRGEFRPENRLSVRAVYRFPFKRFGLSHRSQFEYRIRQPQNSWRYRPSLTFHHDIPKKIINKAKFYLTEEIFYDSLLDKFSRNRVTVGVTKVLNPKLSLDVYYMRQNDGYSRPGDLNAIGTNWKIKF